MKSPQELARKLTRQWEDADLRETRLLSPESAFPISLAIGKPSPTLVTSDLDGVKKHVSAWRDVTIGQVHFETIPYRATAGPVDMPVAWKLRDPSDWATVSTSESVKKEFRSLSSIIEKTPRQFHSLLVRQRSLTRGRSEAEVVQATRLALALEPGCAQGQPLRSLSLERIDTKFFERNKRLITALLDVRFDGEASRTGLVSFLDGAPEGEHWLLLIDLDGSLLPFRRSRVTGQDLQATELPATQVLIVENERSLHQLPDAPDTIAVLGCGFDLTWTTAPWLRRKRVAYWGDIDTWGLELLAKARKTLPRLTSLLMSREVFDKHKQSSVPEPVPASLEPSLSLTEEEQALYHFLRTEHHGRLEQEFLPVPLVHGAIQDWIRIQGEAKALR